MDSQAATPTATDLAPSATPGDGWPVVVEALLEMPHVAEHRRAVAVGAAVAFGLERDHGGRWPSVLSSTTRIWPGSLSVNSACRLPWVP